MFRIGVIESRDAVVLVVKTPRPVELTGGVCDPTKVTTGGDEELYKEPVLVTEAFTADDEPRWTQPTTTAASVLAAATILEVAQQPLPHDGHMPTGTYPDDAEVDKCTFVQTPLGVGDLHESTTSELIKEILRHAAEEDGFQVPGRLDISNELINRLRITIADE